MKIDFEFDTPHGLFRDALYLEDDHIFTDEEIQTMKSARIDNWIAVVTAPPIEESIVDFIEIDGVQYVKVV
jgi:hypothetical protein